MGSELPDELGNTPSEGLPINGVMDGPADCDAVLFTHYHGDHIGRLSEILPGIPLFICFTITFYLLLSHYAYL